MTDDASGGDRNPGLEARLARLEEIVDRLENEELELDDALLLFEEGIGHVKSAHTMLEGTRLRVEKLTTDLDGSVAREPLDSSE